MSRVPLVSPQDATPEARAVYDRQEAAVGRVLTTTQVRAHCPDLLVGIEALQRGQEQSTAAPAGTKALVSLLVSRLNACAH